jgi:hypothetical protein
MNATANTAAVVIIVIAAIAKPGAVLSTKVISSNNFAVAVTPSLAKPVSYFVRIYGGTTHEHTYQTWSQDQT